MKIDHVAIWTTQLEILKSYYVRYFNGRANNKYVNKETGFESYFISFDSGSSLEIMQKPGIPENLNDKVTKQHLGIIHLAFGVDSMELVNRKSEELAKAGFRILRGPRKTGDGFYEFESLDPDNNRVEVVTIFLE
jgi:lactoylglutathione lyase